MARRVPSLLLLAILLFVFIPASGAGASEPMVRVALIEGGQRASISSSGPWTIYNSGGQTILDVHAGFPVEFKVANGMVEVEGHGSVASPVIVRSHTTYLELGGRPYRGDLRVEVVGDGLLVINVVPMESYLYGVVPREMPGSWPTEALRSQAVAARTYAMRAMINNQWARYDVVSTTLSQVYGGVRDESENPTAAVDATRGQILTHGGQPILAAYHASSGGHTENVENVWSLPLSYLTGVPDTDQGSPFYSWQATFTLEGLKSYFDRAGLSVGEVYGVDLDPVRGVSGRVIRVTVRGSERDRTMSSDLFRRTIGLRSTLFELTVSEGTGQASSLRHAKRDEYVVIVAAHASDERMLTYNMALSASSDSPRRMLDASIVSAGASGPVILAFEGGGWGHGVGMSQYGARAMAESGKSYSEILAHYYQGTVLQGSYGR